MQYEETPNKHVSAFPSPPAAVNFNECMRSGDLTYTGGEWSWVKGFFFDGVQLSGYGSMEKIKAKEEKAHARHENAAEYPGPDVQRECTKACISKTVDKQLAEISRQI
jgi:hypothetical protein